MNTSSEYIFPVFISSTDYNLKDLRAELARHLVDLGYRPILSSAEGFPDCSPSHEPWESCLPVLDSTFLVILIIDGRYGAPFKWPNYSSLTNDKEVSPTHAEYLYAHSKKKRLFVFIRREMMTYYQLYRTVLKREKDPEKVQNVLKDLLPEYIDVKTLQFIHEVKTTRPIPWITEFDDITAVKREVQKKLLNELCLVFQAKELHVQSVISNFNKALATLSTDEQIKALSQVDAAKDILKALGEVSELKKQLIEAERKMAEQKNMAEGDKEALRNEIKTLKSKVAEKEAASLKEPNGYVIRGGNVQLTVNRAGVDPFIYGSNAFDQTSVVASPIFATRKCDKCSKPDTSSIPGTLIYTPMFNTCPECNRYLCNECWPKNISMLTTASNICPDCQAKKSIAVGLS